MFSGLCNPDTISNPTEVVVFGLIILLDMVQLNLLIFLFTYEFKFSKRYIRECSKISLVKIILSFNFFIMFWLLAM